MVAFVVGIILARLLSPREFGLVGMVAIFTGFASLFRDMGLSSALVQKQDVTQDHLSSVFWLNVGVGSLLTIGLIASAPLIAGFYNEPILVPITMVLGVNFIVGSLGTVHRTLFQKSIDFKSIALVGLAATFVSGGIGVGMAFADYGVWSLVAKGIVSTVLSTGLFWMISSWRPRFSFSWKATKDLLGFSLNLLGERSLNYWVRRLDDLLIGRVLGSDALGLYTKAYGVMLIPVQKISGVVSGVMFPSLSLIQEDKQRVRRTFFRMTRTIALVTFPIMLGLLATCESFVIGILGPQWSGMIPILQILCVLGVTQSVGTLKGNLFMSQGRTDLQFRVGLFVKTMMITGVVVGLQWGVVGVACGYAIASLLGAYPEWYFAGRTVGFTFSELASKLSGIFACAVTMAAAVYLLGVALPPDWPHWLRLVTQVPTGVAVYWALVYGFDVQAYRETVDLLVEQWKVRQGSAVRTAE